MAADERCPCGRPLHYTSPAVQQYVEDMITKRGPLIKVTVVGLGSWLVPRHYLALHGLAGREFPLLAIVLGFDRAEGRP